MGLRTLSGLGAILLLATAGCASSKSAEQPTTESSSSHDHDHHHDHEGEGHGGKGHGGMGGMCPMNVPGTKVSAADVEGGVALSFTTTDPAQVDELQQRIHGMAAMHNEKHAEGGHGMPAATATPEDLDDGARVVIRPTDPSQLDTLREQVHQRAQRMNEDGCPHKGMHHAHPDGDAQPQ